MNMLMCQRVHINGKKANIATGIYLFKVNNRNTRTRREKCSYFSIKTAGVFIVNFKQFFRPCSGVSVVNFEHVISGWDIGLFHHDCKMIIKTRL